MALPLTVWTSIGDVPPAVVTGDEYVGQAFASIGDVANSLVESASPLIGQVVTSLGDLPPADL